MGIPINWLINNLGFNRKGVDLLMRRYKGTILNSLSVTCGLQRADKLKDDIEALWTDAESSFPNYAKHEKVYI